MSKTFNALAIVLLLGSVGHDSPIRLAMNSTASPTVLIWAASSAETAMPNSSSNSITLLQDYTQGQLLSLFAKPARLSGRDSGECPDSQVAGNLTGALRLAACSKAYRR
ncbi:MAG TPA: hypothetical protein VMV10_29355 [Pirellulales bacterium]|nr:hypothetical protein [Pirellulales bacterium]